MASAACWRCTGRALLESSTRSRSSSLSRFPRSPIQCPTLGPQTPRGLHTTPPLPAAAKGGDPRKGKLKVNKPMNLKNKKKVVTSVKKPEIGYRRNLRKAILLSNANAPVLDLPELTAPIMSDFDNIGKVFSINVEDLEKLRHLDAFQKKQMWQFFYRPTTFIRNESVAIARAMERVERYTGEAAASPATESQTVATETTESAEPAKPSEQEELEIQREKAQRQAIYLDSQKGLTSPLRSWKEVEDLRISEEISIIAKKEKREDRIKQLKETQETASHQFSNYIITGKGGTGKSILLLQATVLAIKRKWMVLSIPNAHEVVIGTSSYEINAETGRYVQRQYLSQLLAKIGRANTELLLATKVQDDVDIGNAHVKAGSPLISIVDAGSSGPEHSYEAFTALLRELEKPGAPPVLFTMDNLEYAMRPVTGYKSPEFKDVYPHDLDIIHTFLEYLSGRRKFARQVIITSTTSELHPNPSLELAIHGKPLPGIGNYDYRIPTALGDVAQTITMKGLNRAHTKLLLEFYKSAGLWDHSWDRSVPIAPALEKAGITEAEYRELKGHNEWNVDTLKAIEEGAAAAAGGKPDQQNSEPSVPISEIKKMLQVEAEQKAKEGVLEMQRMMAALAERPLTEHEVVERHTLTDGVPRQLLKLCLRTQGSLNM